MSDTWGKGAKNNTIGWGSAACTTTNDWGKSQKDSSVAASWSGDTDISGCSGAALSITYSSSAFCEDASDPTPTVTDNVGAGTFSSTTGLVFVSTSTGQVDISASTSGATYVITYTDTDAATATFSLTINDLDNAAFAYSQSSYSPTDADPTPTVTGLSGGTFSAGSGLVFVDSGSNTGSSTGQIDLSASTIASYTITYTTAGTCPNTSTQTVEIAAALAQVNNVYSMEFDSASSQYINLGVSPPPLNTSFQKASFSLWAKTTAWGTPSSGFDLFNNRPNAYSGIALNTFTSSMYLYPKGMASNISFNMSSSGLVNNDWNHIAISIDSTKTVESDRIKIYINGVSATLTGAITLNSTFTQSTADFTIGSGLRGFYDGAIDEFAMWDVALTEQEVQSIYNATETGKTADLNDLTTPPVKWYRMGD